MPFISEVRAEGDASLKKLEEFEPRIAALGTTKKKLKEAIAAKTAAEEAKAQAEEDKAKATKKNKNLVPK